jgi:hypothetical protein
MSEKLEEPVAEEEGVRGSARELAELLQELRVALPGVQVLFAFLLVVPFSEGFSRVSFAQQVVYFLTLLSTAAATVFLISPTAHHRILWRQGAREHRLKRANTLTIIGMVFLALSMSGAVYLITDFLFGAALAAGVVAGAIAGFVCLWFAVPLFYLLRNSA